MIQLGCEGHKKSQATRIGPLCEMGAKGSIPIMLQERIEKTCPNSEETGELTISGDVCFVFVTANGGLAGALCGVLTIRRNRRTAERKKFGPYAGFRRRRVDPHGKYPTPCEICNPEFAIWSRELTSKISRLAENCLLSVPTVIRGNATKWSPCPHGITFTWGWTIRFARDLVCWPFHPTKQASTCAEAKKQTSRFAAAPRQGLPH